MRLRRIELTNIRRFAGQRAVLEGLGDGVTVLCEPNESGKSTFFDALHALFFERHRSSRAPVRALQPHAGGAPEIAVGIELPQGDFLLRKRFLSRPQASVTDGQGRLIAQEDEAEAWIDRLMAGGLAGPSGLLWVRQGVLGLEPEGAGADQRRQREDGLAARRDLLSSVAGEIEMMTGGRRMDAVLDRVRTEIARLATDTGRPRAGGEWKRAVDEAKALADQEGALRERAQRLSGDLARRAQVLSALAALGAPDAVAARTAALDRARQAHDAALAHADRLTHAARDCEVARMALQAATREWEDARQLSERTQQARAGLAAATAAAETARDRAALLAAREAEAGAAVLAAGQALRGLRERMAAAQRARLARGARQRAADLARALDRAQEIEARLRGDRVQRAQLSVTPKALAEAERAQTALDRMVARAEAQAVSIETEPDGPPALLPDGTALQPGARTVLERLRLTLPGFGALVIDPGTGQGGALAAEMAAARRALDQALAACGAAELTAARGLLQRADRLDEALRQGGQALADLAPEGLEALREALAQAEAEAGDAPSEAEDPAQLEPELDRAEAAEAEAQARATVAGQAAAQAGEARAAAEAERRAAARMLEAAEAQAGAPEALAARLAALSDARPAQEARLAEAEAAHRRLAETAPDLETARAALTRATSVVEQARKEQGDLSQERAGLDSRIATLAEEGLEETLEDLAGQRAATEARAARYEAEVAALTRLRDALEQARTRQRDAYFRPVLRELQPLLSILHPGAGLQIDDGTLLPQALTRDGQAETLDILSGGTREQVAILTRLAFARLFAQAGRAVPVILDDALVHTDDERIEAMFTALHRIAADQQVLVLTCRQRAFASLGGHRARMRIEPA